MIKKSIVLWLLMTAIVVAEELPWKSNYEKGLTLLAQGQYEQAVAFLKMAVADKPISEIVKTDQGVMEYLPYLQLAIAYHHLGKDILAAQFLQLEETLSALGQSKGGQKLVNQYRSKISAKGTAARSQEEQSIRFYKKKGYLLGEEEVVQLKEEIRQRCKLPKADERTYPWYYYYELGLALKNKHDWQRALDSFIAALDNRDQPQKFSRIYGMWFVDYYPYYNIGLAHFHLQNWKCAIDAFRLSQMLEDIPQTSSDAESLQQLKAEAEENLTQNSSDY